MTLMKNVQDLGFGSGAVPSIEVGTARIIIANAHIVSEKYFSGERDLENRLGNIEKSETVTEFKNDVNQAIEEIQMLLPSVPDWPEKNAWASGSFLFLMNADLLNTIKSLPVTLWRPVNDALHLKYPDVWMTATALAILTQEIEGQDCIIHALNSLQVLFSTALGL